MLPCPYDWCFHTYCIIRGGREGEGEGGREGGREGLTDEWTDRQMTNRWIDGRMDGCFKALSHVPGMNKMVINHFEKLFVTKDAGTVIKELEIQHPAARMLVMATQMMEQEVREEGGQCSQ